MALINAGPAADHLAKQIGVVNAAVQRMVSAALWLSPLGVGSLVAASILRACDLLGGWGRAGHRAGCTRHSCWLFGWLDGCAGCWEAAANQPNPSPLPTPAGTLAALGLWVATVLAGLALFAFALLPLLLWAATGRSPLAVARQFAASLLLAFGTGSSVAALPAAMQVG